TIVPVSSRWPLDTVLILPSPIRDRTRYCPSSTVFTSGSVSTTTYVRVTASPPGCAPRILLVRFLAIFNAILDLTGYPIAVRVGCPLRPSAVKPRVAYYSLYDYALCIMLLA